MKKSKTLGEDQILMKAGSGSESTQHQTQKGVTIDKGSTSITGGESSNNEESKSIQQPIKEQLTSIREVVSDTEEESHGRLSLDRKVDMLGVRDAQEEFEIKSQCNRRKSQDFNRES